MEPVTPQYLLEGALYALEQCGVLLHDAVALYRSEAYASATVLAAFAREELGRAQILFDFRKQTVKERKRVTLKGVKSKCDDHITKQKWAQLSMTLRLSGQERAAQQLAKAANPEERTRIIAELRDIMQQKAKRLPQDRHEQRISALYVEPNESGTGWNRPRERTRDAAREFIEDAIGDYATEHDRYVGGMMIQYDDSELFQALQNWSGCPELPRYEWPEP